MSARRLFYVLLGIVILLCLSLLASGYGANVLLSKKSQEMEAAKAKSLVMDQLQANLIKNRADLKRYDELNKIAQSIVPQDKDQAQSVREIINIAAASGVPQLTSVTFPASTLGSVTSRGGSLTQVTPVKDIPGVYLLPITVTVSQEHAVTYDQFVNFLRGLEQNRRTAQVSSVNLQPLPNNPNRVSFTIVINEYIKP